ncbi:hypothetical protein FRC01_006301 [Tulasnella sp. 417]|nr:hypothetical protein FRC01_006301 [Tulasnella sp. 417]
MIIRNSRNQLLEVEYNEGFWDGDLEQGDKMAAFIKLVEPSTSRWQTLGYYRARNSESDSRLLSLPLHNLKHIQIDGAVWRDQGTTLDAPKLSSVTVCRSSVNWRSLSGLQVLILESTNPAFEDLMTVLQASPGLSYLSLKEMWQEMGTDGPPSPYKRTINLPELRTLQIGGTLTDSTSLLLDCIEAPSLETFTVAGGYKTELEDYAQLCAAAGRHIGVFPLPQYLKQPKVSIMTQERVIMFGFEGRHITIWNRTWTGTRGARVKFVAIASAMKRLDSRVCEQVKILDLSCSDNEQVGEYLRVIHAHFPRITQLLVVDGGSCGTEIGMVLPHLSSPSKFGLAEEWILPKLARLKLDLSHSVDTDLGGKLVELTRRRKDAEQTAGIMELRITVAPGAIDASTVAVLRQSVLLFNLSVVGGR